MSRPGAVRVVVIGAGAFGGWTALSLLRAGARVTLVEARSAGNPLSSSGGESRVIRHFYQKRIYVELAQRSLQLWKQADSQWGQGLLHRKGVLLLSRKGDFADLAAAHMRALGVAFEALGPAALRKRYPQIMTEDIEQALFEPDAGYIDARRACLAVRDAFVNEGGAYLQGAAVPGLIRNGEMQGLVLEDGTRLGAEQWVFACGPWLKRLFPDELGSRLKISRQEVYFFRPPASRVEMVRQLPVWADLGEAFWYGIPGADGLFKIADDSRGPEVDPETHSREPGADGIAAARLHMEMRFPVLKDADYVDARVCQYALTPDEDFILARHPGAANAWLVGGGSGHGFKHGPALGEITAAAVLDHRPPPAAFALERFGTASQPPQDQGQ